MIGMTLIADGFGFHIERGYIYAAMFFSSLVEALNSLARRKPRRRDMTLGSLVLFAAVYFAAVATPGPGVAALVARVLGQGLAGVAPFIAGYFRRRHDLAAARRRPVSPLIAKTFAGVFVGDQIRGRRLSPLSCLADGDRAGRRRRGAAAGLAGLARLPRLAVADPRQSEGDGLLPLDHAARRRHSGR